jgi:hypothetical protein
VCSANAVVNYTAVANSRWNCCVLRARQPLVLLRRVSALAWRNLIFHWTWEGNVLDLIGDIIIHTVCVVEVQ